MRAKDHQPLPHPSMTREGRKLRRQQAAADSAAQHGERPCDEVTASPAPVSEGIGSAVSPAVSPPVSPSTVENYKTETDGSQCGNQSGSQSVKKPNCYECKHRGDLPYSAHSECKHPALEGKGRILAIAAIMTAGQFPPFNLTGSKHGIRSGWFAWPLDFDPVWLESCDAFEPRA